VHGWLRVEEPKCLHGTLGLNEGKTDEVGCTQNKRGGRGNRSGSSNAGGRRRERVEYPRDGVRKVRDAFNTRSLNEESASCEKEEDLKLTVMAVEQVDPPLPLLP
jgi:hypothetical protein